MSITLANFCLALKRAMLLHGPNLNIFLCVNLSFSLYLTFIFTCHFVNEYSDSTVACYVAGSTEAVLCYIKSNHKIEHYRIKMKH